jgi:diacylglycerol kinase (ATP)
LKINDITLGAEKKRKGARARSKGDKTLSNFQFLISTFHFPVSNFAVPISIPMLQGAKIAAVVNPHSAGGKTGKRWPRISGTLERRLGPIAARFTEGQGHAIAVTRELLREGFDLIVAVGGDGTFNEVANGFIEGDQLVRPGARLGILPTGTGGDFQKMFGLSSGGGLDRAIQLLVDGSPRYIDVGKARFMSHGGAIQERYFVNLVSFGIGGFVAARSRNFLTPLGGKLAFLWATFVVLLAYRGRNVTLTVEGSGAPATHHVTDICIGNGRFYGGGMQPCPTAVMDDGALEVTVIDYMNMFRLLRDIRILYSADVYRHPKTHHLRGARIEATADIPTFVQIDGESVGRLPIEITILPRLLPIVCAGILGSASGLPIEN